MFVKFVVLFAMVALASASNDLSSFAYSVADPYTGDFKHQIENRVDNNVQGQYSLLESDGTRRTVDYAAGAGGFNAVVRKDPTLIAAAPVISYAARAVAAPAISYAAAPAIAGPAFSYAARGIAAPAIAYGSPYGYAKFGAFGSPLAYSKFY